MEDNECASNYVMKGKHMKNM